MKYANLDTLSLFLDKLKLKFAAKADFDTLSSEVDSLQEQVLSDSIIIADATTGVSYVLQIQNGQLVSFPKE